MSISYTQREDNPHFNLYNHSQPKHPVLISIPHAGRVYPPDLLDKLRVRKCDILRLEDRYVDRLAQSVKAVGFTVITATRPRLFLDLNRAENDLDPAMIRNIPASFELAMSRKMRGGLGLFPRFLSGVGDIWRHPFDYTEMQQRIAQCHIPYHNAVAATLDSMRAVFGRAILLDLHSMPSLMSTGNPAQIVIGDRFGSSASTFYSGLLEGAARACSLAVALNHPYPGDYILRKHGNTRRDIHAIQLEICRSLYLDISGLEPDQAGVARMCQFVLQAAYHLSDAITGGAAIAAE